MPKLNALCGRIRTAAIVPLLLASAISAFAQPASDAPQPLKDLAYFVGEWAVTGRAGGEAYSETDTCAWNDRFVVCHAKEEGASKPVIGGIFSYSELTRTVLMTNLREDGHMGTMELRRDGTGPYTAQYPVPTRDGKGLHMRMRITLTSPTQYDSSMERSDDGGKTWRAVASGVAKKQP